MIQSEYAQRGCNLRQIESRYLRRHILRYLDLRVSGDVIPKSAYLDARRKVLWAKKLSSWSFLPSTSCLMRAYSGSSVFLAVLRVVRYKTHECLKSLRHVIAENIVYSCSDTSNLPCSTKNIFFRYLFIKRLVVINNSILWNYNIKYIVMRHFHSNKKIKM